MGKWKIRKKITGGADAGLFTIRSGEPQLENAKGKANLGEGYLSFINPPEPGVINDANKDGVYEVLIGYVNTTYGDTRVPIPSFNNSITISQGQEDIIELVTNKIPLQEVDRRRITSDTDADGLINPIDPDDDGDHIYSKYETQGENRIWQRSDDFDNDQISNYLDPDDENDGVFTEFENPDPNQDFNPSDAQDTDNDGVPDYFDTDDDGDGILTIEEGADPNSDGNPLDAVDSDQDGIPDYLDPDDDNDGVDTILELNGSLVIDTDQDGIPDYLDIDDDNDGILTRLEINFSNADIDEDGIPNYLDINDDGDQLNSIEEDLNANGDPTDDDTDLDNIFDAYESTLTDCDEDGVMDQFDAENCNPYNDSDGDGFANIDELNAGNDPNNQSDFPANFEQLNLTITDFFSPNGDGINDTWQTAAIDRYPNNEVWVYARAGLLVFNKTNYQNDWDGNQNGNPLPEGSYYYLIDFNQDGQIDYKGWLFLTR